jgi:hypothetical protein
MAEREFACWCVFAFAWRDGSCFRRSSEDTGRDVQTAQVWVDRMEIRPVVRPSERAQVFSWRPSCTYAYRTRSRLR